MEFEEIEVEEGYGLPEAEHVEMMFDGLADTIEVEQQQVAGVENITLTSAYRYAHNVLGSAGMIPFNAISGNEGFFDSVGEGIKKIWEYIKKMFAYIFGGFLKKEVKEEVNETKDSIKNAEAKLNEQEKPTTKITPAKLKASIKPSVPEAEKIKIVKNIEELDAAKADNKPLDPNKVKTVSKEIFNANLINDIPLKASAEKMTRSIRYLEEIRDNYKKEGNMGEISVQTFLNGLTGLPEAIAKIKDITTAKEFLHKASRSLEAMKNNFTTFENDKSSIESRIKEVERALTSDNKIKNKEKTLEGLKKELATLSKVCKLGKDVMASIRAISDQIKRACVTG